MHVVHSVWFCVRCWLGGFTLPRLEDILPQGRNRWPTGPSCLQVGVVQLGRKYTLLFGIWVLSSDQL